MRAQSTFDYAIVGGGIIGLATSLALGRRNPNARIVLFEKEAKFAQHQSGRNSGVIHSGIYYKPGSLKARFAREGNHSMFEFCQDHGIPYKVCGKVIVAVEEKELSLLENLFQRGRQNQLKVERLSAGQVREIEPHVKCLAGIKVPSTGITDFAKVCAKYVELIQQMGGTVKLGAMVEAIRVSHDGYVVETSHGPFETRFLINCAGLHSDRVARLGGMDPEAKIIPFRGEYYKLIPERRHLVRTLIYPVPNLNFPFLGVHFTRMIDGSVHAGPNAVLSFKREGYHKTSFNLADFVGTTTFGGFWKLAQRHLDEGWMEMRRSFSKTAFVRSLQRLIPELRMSDVVPTHAGVRAQAVWPDGSLVDDFLIIKGRNSVHVCNAPSPAATASLEIGRALVDHVPEMRPQTTVAV
jgi:(S)-2-hydroxyglutarate dehydrogenase